MTTSNVKNTFIEDFAPTYEGRCARCYMRLEKCICDHIPAIDHQIRLTVLMHHRESYKPTNTARLAHLCLKNSQIIIRGLPRQPVDFTPLIAADEEPLFLTLSDKSEVLTPELAASFTKRPHLIVPDGNWRQAGKVGKREKAVQAMRWVKLPPGPPSRYRLRHEHLAEGLSTLEAIARAYGILESPAIQSRLEEIFELMVTRTLETRPKDRVP